jgi:hypothetical protein
MLPPAPPPAGAIFGLPTPNDTPEDDELDELPPLDGDGRDAPEPEATSEDLPEDADTEASLDDSTGEDAAPDTTDLDLGQADGQADGGWLEEPPDAPDLDLGDVAMIDFGEGTAAAEEDSDEASEGDGDLGLADGPERGDLDAGDEGPLDEDEELRESDLPALDADEEGELDDEALVDAGFAADEPLGLPWAAEPWSRVGAPVALTAATAIACTLRGAIVSGRAESGVAELSRLDLEGTCQGIPGAGIDAAAVRGLAVAGDVVAAVVEDRGAFVSRDGGATFGPIAEALAVVEAVVTPSRVWLRTRPGGLFAVDGEAGVAQRCATTGAVAATAGDGEGFAALVVDDAGAPVGLLRGRAPGALRREAFAGPEAAAPALVAVRGDHVAYAARRGGVVHRMGAGSAREVSWEGRVTALVIVDDAGTLVAATYSAGDDTTALVRVDQAGQASVVARVGPASGDAEADGRVRAMAFDEAHGVVWVAGGFGVAAFAVR